MKKNDDAVVVLGYARTPVGSFGKSLAKVPAHILGATAAKAARDSLTDGGSTVMCMRRASFR